MYHTSFSVECRENNEKTFDLHRDTCRQRIGGTNEPADYVNHTSF